MIDNALVQWAVNEAATGSRTYNGEIQAPDVDIEAVAGQARIVERWGIAQLLEGYPVGAVIAAAWSEGFCAGVAAGRAEVVE